MNRRFVLLLVSLLSFLGITARAEPLAVGVSAPKPVATDENAKAVDFGTLYAKGLTLVYFYPMASTPGCTAQACSLRDGINDLKGLGVTVVGVSHSNQAAQKKFKDENKLPFTLVADPDGTVAKAFGVPTYAFGITKRQSFLVKEGKVVWRSLSAQTATHADEVKKAVVSLK